MRDISLHRYYLPFERLSDKCFSCSFLSIQGVYREEDYRYPAPPPDRLHLWVKILGLFEKRWEGVLGQK